MEPELAIQRRNVFISYAHKDSSGLALKLHDALVAVGHQAWIDRSGIAGGTQWGREIESAIDACDCLLALLSEASYRSEICRAEQLLCLEAGKPVIPILVQTNARRPLHIFARAFYDFSNAADFNKLFLAILQALSPVELAQAHSLSISGYSDLLKTGSLLHWDAGTTAPQAKQSLTLDGRAGSLPYFATRFVGREYELNELEAMVSERSLVTIKAPGGYGKSRLAVEFCTRVHQRFSHGVFFVELAPIDNFQRIVYQIANAVGFQFYSGKDPEDQVIDYLREKELLLCLDNYEHLLFDDKQRRSSSKREALKSASSEPCPPEVELVCKILREAPRVKLLITSRQLLGLQGEQQFDLLALQRTEIEERKADEISFSEAAKLFADRAALKKPQLLHSAASSPLIEIICAKLDGVPLAIELAAAWTDQMSLPELLAELSAQLDLPARYDELPQRQRSIRASLDWSWNRLSDEQQRTVMILSTFRGGFFLDAAAAVLKLNRLPLLKLLGQLIDRSWLYTREISDQTRYYLRDAASHEYAFFKLQATQETHPRTTVRRTARRSESMPPPSPEQSLYEQAVMAHSCYFATMLEREGPKLTSHEQTKAMHIINADRLNIIESFDTLKNRIQPLVSSSNSQDESTINRLAELSSALIPILRWFSDYMDRISENKLMLELFNSLIHELAKASTPTLLQYWVCVGAGRCYRRLSAFDAAREQLLHAQQLALVLNDEQAIARVLSNIGAVDMWQSRLVSAHSNHAKALTISQSIGDRFGIAVSLDNLGFVEYLVNEYESSLNYHNAALSIYREFGDNCGIASSLTSLGAVANAKGDTIMARKYFEASLQLKQELGDKRGIVFALKAIGNIEYAKGDLITAISIFDSCLEIAREIGDLSLVGQIINSKGITELMVQNIPDARSYFIESLAIREQLFDVHGFTQAHSYLAITDYYLGELLSAADHCTLSLTKRMEIQDKFGICECLIETACLLLTELYCSAETCAARSAAVLLFGALQGAERIHFAYEPVEQKLLSEGLESIQQHSLGLTAEDIDAAREKAATYTLDELAQEALSNLETFKAKANIAKV